MPEQRNESPWKLGGLNAKEVGRRAYKGIDDDDVLGRAAELAYYFFFAIFPLGIFLIAVMGLIIGGTSAEQQFVDALARGVPGSAQQMVRETVQHSFQASGGGKLGLGIVLALISASAGMSALMGTLNAVYEVREGRSFIKQRAIAIGLTIGTGILVLIALGLITVGGHVAHQVAGGALYWVWNILQYPIAIAFLLLSYSLIYYYAPNVEHPQWHWVTPGSAVGVVLWIIVSFGLRVYLHYSNTYAATYGALGAVMILLLWFYVTGLAMLIGGEVNAVVERAALARRGTQLQQAEGGGRQRSAA